jgi:pyruvate/2-oxoglutarate dehydrogenase complex dihydrolipoamide acyltransferase (E2) component
VTLELPHSGRIRDRMGRAGGSRVTWGGAAVALAFGLAGSADAQEYCVACTEPSAVYRCVIDGARPGGGQPLQMLCVTAMAREGRHATCSVKRGTVFDCNGPVKHVPWSAAEAPAAAPAQTSAAPQPERAAAPKQDPDAPPKTMVELAKRANEKTAEQMRQAGENVKDTVKSTGQAIGNATKKTWDCMISFFTRC